MTTQGTIRVIQYGLGPIGSATARQIVEQDGLELVGGVDIDPAKVGEDLGEVIGLDHPLGIAVVDDLSTALAEKGADLALHTTNSYFDLFQSQLSEIFAAGLNIVSTAEELSFPWLAHPEQATKVDSMAKQAGKTVLGTGVNPGFLMDLLPLNLTALCRRVDRITVKRVINASTRRGPFQIKVGAGMTVADFTAAMDEGRMGHVGLPESVGMVFHTMGKTLSRYKASVEPVVADRLIKTDAVEVAVGRVRGLKQVARGYTDEGEFVTLTFIAALDEKDEGDTINIVGTPDLEVKLKGTNGDIATVAIAVNAIRRVNEAAPGLVTMRDLPVITNW